MHKVGHSQDIYMFLHQRSNSLDISPVRCFRSSRRTVHVSPRIAQRLRSLAYLLACLLTYSLACLFACLLVCSPACLLARLFAQLLACLFAFLLGRLPMFACSFACWLTYFLTCFACFACFVYLPCWLALLACLLALQALLAKAGES